MMSLLKDLISLYTNFVGFIILEHYLLLLCVLKFKNFQRHGKRDLENDASVSPIFHIFRYISLEYLDKEWNKFIVHGGCSPLFLMHQTCTQGIDFGETKRKRLFAFQLDVN